MVKNPPANAGRRKRLGLDPWLGKIPGRRAWRPTPVFLPGESHGQRSLAGCSPQGRKELGMTEATWHTQACTLVIVFFVEHYKTYIAVSLSLSLSLYTFLEEQINTTTLCDHFIKKKRETG